MQDERIDQIRRFNRTVTQRIGALDDAYLSRDRPLGQARLLWEIGTGTSEVRALRSRLGLDSGYLSRLLRALQADGLVVVEAADADGRVREVRLTPDGLAELAELDRRSDDSAAAILQPLNESQRDRLVSAMADVERLLTASMVRVDAVDPGHPDARYCIQAFFAELADRLEAGFDPGVSHTADPAQITPPAGLLLVATLHDEPVGCGAFRLRPGPSGVVPGPDAYAELKHMWVSPTVRGLGLGRRLVAELEAHVAGAGVRTVRLDTNGALVEAIGFYKTAGYREIDAYNDEPYADHWFEKTL
ncbi:bifunctional helix-turn-helix transcriptional regulator/GNAT family N-acetyltransferase [Polymorphospora rubra]|uniref:Putative transcriptional regulator, MarR family protein n=1 Tax=Polymorphospora rubra TaxID=338584 RepID=A0A810NB58_9ACTN|nr:helix-turn-helix domain-containing GNAT family N-acetyltransferase [Polymorphospora rubra]BCJ68783.1 putative transcriptional regulator, MarR family protein [Polymorphospora rubra]